MRVTWCDHPISVSLRGGYANLHSIGHSPPRLLYVTVSLEAKDRGVAIMAAKKCSHGIGHATKMLS